MIIPGSGFLGMPLGATLGVQIVPMSLALMGLWSWVIIIQKLIAHRRAGSQVAEGSACSARPTALPRCWTVPRP